MRSTPETEAGLRHPPLPAGTVALNGPAQACVVDKIEQFAVELPIPKNGSPRSTSSSIWSEISISRFIPPMLIPIVVAADLGSIVWPWRSPQLPYPAVLERAGRGPGCQRLRRDSG